MTDFSIASSTSIFTSAQVLATMKHYVSSTVDDIRQESTPETYFHRIIFTSMMKEFEVNDNVHKDDDLHSESSQELGDCATRFRPVYWIFVGPGSESTGEHDRKTNGFWDQRLLRILLHISTILSPSFSQRHHPQAGHPHTKSRQDSIRLNASTESTSILCKLIESANIIGILFAIKKCLDGLHQGNLLLEQRGQGTLNVRRQQWL